MCKISLKCEKWGDGTYIAKSLQDRRLLKLTLTGFVKHFDSEYVPILVMCCSVHCAKDATADFASEDISIFGLPFGV